MIENAATADQCPDCGTLYTGHGMDPPPYCGHEFGRYVPVRVVVAPPGSVVLTAGQRENFANALWYEWPGEDPNWKDLQAAVDAVFAKLSRQEAPEREPLSDSTYNVERSLDDQA